MPSKLFHAIVLVGASLGAAACNRASPLPGPGDASAPMDASAIADLSTPVDLTQAPQCTQGLCSIDDGNFPRLCCSADHDACFPCFI